MEEKRKKIAVIVRDDGVQALRMALGLSLLNDEVSVFIMDEQLELTESVAMSLQGLKDMGARIYTNLEAAKFERMSTEDIARALLEFDVIIPY